MSKIIIHGKHYSELSELKKNQYVEIELNKDGLDYCINQEVTTDGHGTHLETVDGGVLEDQVGSVIIDPYGVFERCFGGVS